jgi:hypothetical protein
MNMKISVRLLKQLLAVSVPNKSIVQELEKAAVNVSSI